MVHKKLLLSLLIVLSLFLFNGCDTYKKYKSAKEKIDYLEAQLAEKEAEISNLNSRIYQLEEENRKLNELLKHHEKNIKKMFD
jgi:peptidoglycan hydrolase CwlO-like protein